MLCSFWVFEFLILDEGLKMRRYLRRFIFFNVWIFGFLFFLCMLIDLWIICIVVVLVWFCCMDVYYFYSIYKELMVDLVFIFFDVGICNFFVYWMNRYFCVSSWVCISMVMDLYVFFFIRLVYFFWYVLYGGVVFYYWCSGKIERWGDYGDLVN